jgi:chromosome segregation ATPase
VSEETVCPECEEKEAEIAELNGQIDELPDDDSAKFRALHEQIEDLEDELATVMAERDRAKLERNKAEVEAVALKAQLGKVFDQLTLATMALRAWENYEQAAKIGLDTRGEVSDGATYKLLRATEMRTAFLAQRESFLAEQPADETEVKP